MSLVQHAKNELAFTGYGDDYDGMIGTAVMELIEKFADQGHSGYSAFKVAAIFNELASYRPLSELTRNPDEWMHIEEAVAGRPDMWQNKRRPDAFSTNGGMTYYLLDEPADSEYISMPYEKGEASE